MRPFAAQRGFTMLEVMITLVVFAIGMLGMAGMQVIANSAHSCNRFGLRHHRTYARQSDAASGIRW